MLRRPVSATAALTLLVCCALLMALVVMLHGAWQDWQRGEAIIHERTLAVARFYQTRQVMRTTATEVMLATLAQTPVVRDGASEALDDFMRRLDLAQPDYLGFAVFDTQGRALATVAGGQNFAAQPPERVRAHAYFKGALEKQVFTVGLGLSSRSQPGKMYLPMALPVMSSHGDGKTIQSIIFAPLDMSRISQEDMDSGVTELMRQYSMDVQILDGEGRILYQSENCGTTLGTVLDAPCYIRARETPGESVVLDQVCGETGSAVTVLLKTSLRPGQAPYLQVLVQTPHPSWWSFLLVYYYKSLLGIVASLVFALVVARLVGRHFFSRGLGQLVRVADAMRSGQLDMRCGRVEGCGEIQNLGAGLDAMLDDLERGNRQLREQRQRLEMALDAAEMGIWRWCAMTSFLFMDVRGWGNLGYTGEEVDQVNVLTLLHHADRESFLLALEEHQRGRLAEFSQEVRLRQADGESAWVLFVGKVAGREDADDVQGVCLDVTARRRVVELEREQMEHYRRLSTTDPLTGLWNRRYFSEAARGEVLRCLRNGNAVSIIMTDIDFFKKINDTYGHAAGDAVLRHFADVMRQSVRATDLVARYGGEEFVLILPETEICDAVKVAEKVRAAYEFSSTPWEGSSIASTASFGVCGWTPQRDNVGYAGQKQADSIVDRMVGMADASLYTSKQQGRNRVTSCTGCDATVMGDTFHIPDAHDVPELVAARRGTDPAADAAAPADAARSGDSE